MAKKPKTLRQKLFKKFRNPFKKIDENYENIKYIENPSEELQMAAVRTDGSNIRFIQNPTEKVKLYILSISCVDIKWIRDQSEKIQLAALENAAKTPSYIKYLIWDMKKPTIAVQKRAIYLSNYDLDVIRACPNWRDFVEEIENEMIIKDIIE